METTVTPVGFREFAAQLGIAAEDSARIFQEAANTTALSIRRVAQAKVAKRTRTLMDSIIAEPLADGAMVSVQQPYGIYVEYGTGIYGPKGTPITPKRAKVLAWKGDGGMVFARSVKGQPAQPYFNPAVDLGAIDLGVNMAVGLDELMGVLSA